jgi:hypothetical protein
MFVTLAKVYCVKNYAAAQKGYQQVRQLKERYRRAVFSDHVLHKISRPTGVSNKKRHGNIVAGDQLSQKISVGSV